MSDPPVPTRDRLTLRLPEDADVPCIAELAGEREIPRTTPGSPRR